MLSCYDVMSNSHLQAPHPPALRTRSGRTIRKVTDTDLQVIGPAERAEMDKHDRMQTALFRWRYASLVKAWNAWKAWKNPCATLQHFSAIGGSRSGGGHSFASSLLSTCLLFAV